MTYAVTLIPGDGIGPEITAETVKALEATGVGFVWDAQSAGMAAVTASGTPIPEATIASIRERRVALKGPLTTPVASGYRSVNVALRREFDLYANLRPARTIVPGRYDRIDIVLVRENLEGFYTGLEHWVATRDDPHSAGITTGITTRYGCDRIIRYAFEYALKHGRKKVTIVHKANILRMVSGLFLEVGRAVAKEFEGQVEANDMIVDNCAMQLVLRPEQFDVVVTTNLFGDILSDEIAGLVGGLGLAPGGNIGSTASIFEAVHGSAPDIAGQDRANPIAAILSAAMLLEHSLKHGAAAAAIEVAVGAVLDQGYRTPDIQQPGARLVGTCRMGDLVAEAVRAGQD